MRKRYIAIFVALTGMIMFAANGNTAHADTQSGQPAADSSTSRTITVGPGDYLDKLATDNGTTYLRLFYANDEIKDPNLIYPGETLRVPDASENLTPRALPEDTGAPAQASSAYVPQVTTPRATYQATAPAPAQTAPAGTSIWDQLAACESGGNWAINTGNGFYGGLQFTLSSWHAVGGSGYPNQASRDEQIYRGQILQSRQGWGAWPACSAKLGLG